MTVNASEVAFAGILNHVKSSSIVASQEATGFDADNLKIPNYSSSWHSTSVAGTVTIDLDLGSVKSDIESIILHGVNLTSAATIRVIADSNAGFPSPEHDTTTIDAFDITLSQLSGIDDTPSWGRVILVLLSPAWTGRYIRISLTDTTNADGYLKVSYVSIGPIAQFGPAQWSTRPIAEGRKGTEIVLTQHSLSYKRVSESVRRQILSLSRALRMTGRFTCIPQPGIGRESTYIHEVILCELSDIVDEDALFGRQWDINFTVKEVYT
jgi:hypothetical protein